MMINGGCYRFLVKDGDPKIDEHGALYMKYVIEPL